jgi:XTP/dITP diphosphohydrolase
MELVIATRNGGKRREFAELARGLDVKLVSLETFPNAVDPEETGLTFQENALIKARAAAEATGLWSLGDDSGLCVDALDGRPGIYSARYASGTDQARWQKLLGELAGVSDERRGAAFVCVLALCGPGGQSFVAEGRCAGRIGWTPRGEQGFGYDPVFQVAGDALGRTLAELSADEKHAISHRGRAFEALRPRLARLVEPG